MFNNILELKIQYMAIQTDIDQGQEWITGKKKELQKVVDTLGEMVDNNKIAGDHTKDLGHGVKVKSAITLKPIIDKNKLEAFKDNGGVLPDGLYVTKESLNNPAFKKLIEDNSEEAEKIKNEIGASFEQSEKITVTIVL